MRTLKYILLAVICMVIGAVLLTWVMIIRFGTHIGVDFWSTLWITPIYEVENYNVPQAMHQLMISGGLFGALAGVAVLAALIGLRGLKQKGGTTGTSTDYAYAGNLSDSSSDGGDGD